jgi:hypothetical protein
MKLDRILAASFTAILGLTVLTACTAAQLSSAESQATAAAQTAENVLETINTDTGGAVTILTTAGANAALKATHNNSDVAIVDATIAEAAAAAKIQSAAASVGATPPDAQALTTTFLTSPSATAIGAQAVPASTP